MSLQAVHKRYCPWQGSWASPSMAFCGYLLSGLLDVVSLASVSSLQRSASLPAATSLFPIILCHKFRL